MYHTLYIFVHYEHGISIMYVWVQVFLVVDKIEFYSASKSCLCIEHLLHEYSIAT